MPGLLLLRLTVFGPFLEKQAQNRNKVNYLLK